MGPVPKLTLALAAAAAFGCVPSSKPNCSPPPIVPLLRLAEPVGHLAQTVELTLRWESTVACFGGRVPNVNQIKVEVADPAGVELEATSTLPVQLGDGGTVPAWETTVVFTPQRLGEHHLEVTFLPEGGVVQRNLMVVEDRRGDVPTSATTSGALCERLERLPPNDLVCQLWGGGVQRYRDGAMVSQWVAATGHVVGDALWLRLDAQTMARVGPAEDGGTRTDTEAAVTLATFGATSATDAISVIRWGLHASSFDGSMLRGSYVEPFTDANLGQLPIDAVAWAPDAGTLVVATAERWARFRLGPVFSDGGVPWVADEGAANQAPDGVWVEGLATRALRFVPADAARPAMELALPVNWEQVSIRASDRMQPGDRPLIFPRRLLAEGDVFPSLDRSEVLVPSVQGGTFLLQHFVAPTGALFMEVSGGQLRATRGNEHFFFPVDR